eukprot:GCRY01002470.1.p1 GENE.GCRY01002470.1~~GCRY01002470.1.p1  ORF type:complete len:329 (-),score=72.05 GCRY01002470.1:33-992(-)
MKVVVTRRIPECGLELLKKGGFEIDLWEEANPIPREELKERVKTADGLLCMLSDKIDKEVLELAVNLKVVSTYSVGFNHIDLAECKKRDILVGYTPDVLSVATAETAMTLMFAAARRVQEAISVVKNGGWKVWSPTWLCGKEITGSTIGIIGFGRIGQSFAQMLAGFNCKILYTGPHEKPEPAKALNCTYTDLDTLLAQSDFVSLHLPLTKENRHMFDATAFAKMKPGAVLINTARGDHVDQEALYTALTQGPLSACGLDVCTPEPLPLDHPLLTLPNCIVLPHIGSATLKARQNMSSLSASNIITALAGGQMPAQVSL